MTKSNKNINKRLEDQLSRVLLSESFKKSVKRTRIEYGIPINGFKLWSEWQKWIVEQGHQTYFKIQRRAIHFNQANDLPHNYYFWFEAFIVMNNAYQKYDSIDPFDGIHHRGFEQPDFCNAISFDKDMTSLSIQLFPGATIKETIKYIRKKKDIINNYLNTFPIKVKAIREKSQKDRDYLVLKLYKKKKIDSYGRITDLNDKEVPEDIKNLDMDLRRKIISTQKKMRK